MDAPAKTRLASAAPDGVLVPSGVATFRRRFSDPATAEMFVAWNEQQITQLVLKVLQDLAVNGPIGMAAQPDDVAVQYGFTAGLSFAAQLMADPSVIFPEVFRGQQAPAKEMPKQTFDTDPEDALLS